MDDDTIKIEHESYGLLQFSRVQSNRGKPLFGSSIRHQNTITATISRSEETRNLNRYWFFPREVLIEIEMSTNQFSEAITTLNQGVGIPVTIRRVMGRQMEDCPYGSQRELFEKEFKGKVLDITKMLKTLEDESKRILDKGGTLLKADRENLKGLIYQIVMNVRSNLPFIQKSYNEAIDKTTNEAKCEIEAYIHHEVIKLGIEAFKEKFALPFEKDEGTIEIEMKGDDDDRPEL